MLRVFARELGTYLFLVIAFAILMHPDLLDNPSSRFSHWIERGNFYHPFIYTLFLYILLFIPRFVLFKLISLFLRAKKSKH